EHHFLRAAALALEAEEGAPVAEEFDVPIAQRRQAVRLVRARVFLVADAQQRCVEQPNYGGEHFILRQTRQREILPQAPAQPRQLRAEFDHAREFSVVARLAPRRMVAVLLALARIASRRLQVTARLATDPH